MKKRNYDHLIEPSSKRPLPYIERSMVDILKRHMKIQTDPAVRKELSDRIKQIRAHKKSE